MAKKKPKKIYHSDTFAAYAVSRFNELLKSEPNYVVQQKHRADDDVVKLWRLGVPDSSVYAFYICSAPNCLMVYGDMGDYMWQRHYDMIPFIRGSVHSTDYFSEKVPSNIAIREERSELVEEWFRDFKEERIACGYEWDKETDTALEEIREAWENYHDPDEFRKALFESSINTDFEECPCTTNYTFQYLWTLEALKWFIIQLDTGKVLPYVE